MKFAKQRTLPTSRMRDAEMHLFRTNAFVREGYFGNDTPGKALPRIGLDGRAWVPEGTTWRRLPGHATRKNH